ncbi:PC4 and SFRS1-interacting protein [Homalodisca vitripennis]|nr:PC4 and SFRS1-interacting protein [Homalodisca vitripennis]
MTTKFEEGDKVFAKLRGYSYWPGVIEDVISNENPEKALKYHINFFGSYDLAIIKTSDESYAENKSEYGRPKTHKLRHKKFNSALKKAEENCFTPIDNYDKMDNIDLRISLTLAAETDSALLADNINLKQNLQSLQEENRDLLLELEKSRHDIRN